MYFTFDRHERSATPANKNSTIIEDWRPRERLSMTHSFMVPLTDMKKLYRLHYFSASISVSIPPTLSKLNPAQNSNAGSIQNPSHLHVLSKRLAKTSKNNTKLCPCERDINYNSTPVSRTRGNSVKQ